MRFAYIIEPPFNAMSDTGQLIGCDVDLARHVLAELGHAFEPVETTFAEMLIGLSDGRWRMATGMFATPMRKKVACFSRPIWALGDGLLLALGNPLGLTGYRSLAGQPNARLAVLRDQVQHHTARSHGIGDSRIDVFETYEDAAEAVRSGRVAAYASVGRAHQGFIARNPDWAVETIPVPVSERTPDFGAFSFALKDRALCAAVDEVLSGFLGARAHRATMSKYGFADAETDLIAP